MAPPKARGARSKPGPNLRSKKSFKTKGSAIGRGSKKQFITDCQVAEFSGVTKQDHHAFDKLIKPGWIKDKTVTLGSLNYKREDTGRYFYEFHLNGTVYEGFSVKNENGKNAFEKLQEGSSYAVKGDLKAVPFDPKFSRSSNSTFKFSILICKLTEAPILQAQAAQTATVNSFKAMNRLIIQKKTFTMKVENVEIFSGEVRRYLGCDVCSRGLSNKDKLDEYYICNTCKKLNYKGYKKRNRTTCLIILNLELKDTSGGILKKGILYHSQCGKLFGADMMQLCASDSDLDASKAFQALCGSTVSCTVKNTKVLRRKRQTHDKFKVQIEIDDLRKGKKRRLVEIGGDSGNIRCNLGRPKGGKCLCELDEELDEDDAGIEIEASDDNLVSSSGQSTNESFYLDTVPNNVIYDLDTNANGFIGLALIINMNFVQIIDKWRRGSQTDVEALESILPKMKIKIFRGKALQDTNKKEFDAALAEFKNELIEFNYSSSFVILMSHGTLYNIKLADESKINVYKHVIPQFGEKVFPSFEDNPKIFIFNACQYFQDTGETGEKGQVDERQVIPNTLECFPCRPGFRSKRNNQKGSYFIQKLVEVFESNMNRNSMHLEEMMQEVQKRMSLLRLGKTKDQVNIPVYKPMLFKAFYFK